MSKPKPPAGRDHRKRRIFIAAVAICLLAAGGATWYWLSRVPLPRIDLAGADPSVARTIEAACAEVRREPGAASAWGRLGQVLYVHNFEDEAAVCLAKAEELDPREPRWPYLQGLLALRTDVPASLPFLRRAVERGGPTPDAPRLKLAETLLELGELDESATHFRVLLRGEPAHPRALLGLGRLEYRRGHAEQAETHLEQARQSAFTRKAATLLLAEVRWQRAPASGRAALEQAAEMPDDPVWPDPFYQEVRALQAGKYGYLTRAEEMRRRGEEMQAQATRLRAEKEHPELYWLVEGRERRNRGDSTGAAQAFRQSIELAPDWFEPHYSLGELLFNDKEYAEAARVLREAARLEPHHAAAQLVLARCLVETGDRPSAIEALRSAVASRPGWFDARRLLGELLAREGRHAEAIEQLRHALRLDPADQAVATLLEKLEKQVKPN